MSDQLRALQRIMDFQKIQANMIKAMVEDGWDVYEAIKAVVF